MDRLVEFLLRKHELTIRKALCHAICYGQGSLMIGSENINVILHEEIFQQPKKIQGESITKMIIDDINLEPSKHEKEVQAIADLCHRLKSQAL